MANIVAAPKVEAAMVKEQEADMRDTLAEIIATKLVELANSANVHGDGEDTMTASWGGDLMKTALKKFRSPEWRDQQNAASLKATAAEASKDGGCHLVHKVIKYDEQNQPLTEVETIVIAPERKEEVEQLPWAEWLEAVVTADFYDEFLARSVFQHALLWLHRHAHACNLATKSPIKTDRPYPIAMQRLRGCYVVVKAMEDIDRECLVIPVFVRRDFIRSHRGSKTVRWNMEVAGSVEWRDGPHDRDVKVLIHCQPERKLPAGTRLEDSDYDLSLDCHPFWHIRRSSCVTECNCDMVEVAIASETRKRLQPGKN